MKSDLVRLLAQNPSAVRTNTPLEVLAAHMIASLQQFEQSLLDRADHKFYHPERFNEESNSVLSAPVPRYRHVGDDEPIPGVACLACEE